MALDITTNRNLINSIINDNTTQQITALDVRTALQNLLNLIEQLEQEKNTAIADLQSQIDSLTP